MSGKSNIDAETCRGGSERRIESEKRLTAESAEGRRRERREKTFPGFLRVLCGISQRSLRSKAVRQLGCRFVSRRFHREEVLREALSVVIQQLRNELGWSLCSFAGVSRRKYSLCRENLTLMLRLAALQLNAESKAKSLQPQRAQREDAENAEKKHFQIFFASSAVFLSGLCGQRLFGS